GPECPEPPSHLASRAEVTKGNGDNSPPWPEGGLTEIKARLQKARKSAYVGRDLSRMPQVMDRTHDGF
nr:hypothetical protein [Cypionkella sp.]